MKPLQCTHPDNCVSQKDLLDLFVYQSWFLARWSSKPMSIPNHEWQKLSVCEHIPHGVHITTHHLPSTITYHPPPPTTHHCPPPPTTYHPPPPTITYHPTPPITHYHLLSTTTYHPSLPTTHHHLPATWVKIILFEHYIKQVNFVFFLCLLTSFHCKKFFFRTKDFISTTVTIAVDV